MHAAGLVHRDVKTSNVMRENGGRIVLMDFGSVSEIPKEDGEDGAGVAGGSGKISGTPLTMAPEVLLRGEAPRPTADIYAPRISPSCATSSLDAITLRCAICAPICPPHSCRPWRRP